MAADPNAEPGTGGGPAGNTMANTANTAAIVNPSSLIQPQLGLLEDDIVYRLALLATNVLQPLKTRYPNIVIKSGFRQTNSGIGQHELGEAVDIQINNQTPQLLYEVACWMRDNLNFDQLILNFTQLGDKQPWIHVSFSPKTLREQVMTKDYADTFHQGLFIVQPVTGEAAAAIRREQAQLDKQILAEMQTMQQRQERLTPVTTVTDEALIPGSAGSEEAPPLTEGGSGGGNGDRAHLKMVGCVRDALWPFIKDLPPAEKAFAIVKRVAWALRSEHCGLLLKPRGDNIISWKGYSFSTQRVCYPDGRIYDILGGAGSGSATPRWADNNFVETSKYVPAIDPGSEFTTNWQSCRLTSSNANTSSNTSNTTTTTNPPESEPDDPPRR